MITPAQRRVLDISAVSKSFRRRDGTVHKAVQDISLVVHPAEAVALVGESGSGKTTLLRIALALIKPDAGDVLLNGQSMFSITPAKLREARVAMQPVFQDSSAAFNPRRTVAQSLAQAIGARRDKAGTGDLDDRIADLLEQVRLYPAERFMNRFPHELSGGQRQRVAIARAIAMDPSLILADEPLSGADVSIRGEILNLMLDLQEQRNMAYLLVTHDMSIAKAFAQRIAVMYGGRIVEEGEAAAVIADPQHPYTRRLVASILHL